MSQLMDAMTEQNAILSRQTVQLEQICSFITPVSSFFAALKNFVIFMAWIVGFITAGIAFWHWIWDSLVNWVKGH